MTRELEPWGGDVRLPRWLRRLLRRPEDVGDTPSALTSGAGDSSLTSRSPELRTGPRSACCPTSTAKDAGNRN